MSADTATRLTGFAPDAPLTDEALRGPADDDPRWAWLTDHPSTLPSPDGAALLAKFGLSNAEALRLSSADAERFIRSGRWDGLGVDGRHMATAARLCTWLLPAARATGCVNQLVREHDGTITGDFTFGTGLLRLLPSLGVEIGDARVLLLADRALEPAARGLAKLLTALGAPAARVLVIDRPAGRAELAGLPEAPAVNVLFNVTNFGRWPDADAMPIDGPEALEALPALRAVLDFVDDPIRPRLVWEASRRGIAARTALGLRVVVAREALEVFAGRPLPLCATRSILCDIRREAANIVLIGMPGCGKTTIGKYAAARLMRPFIDVDTLVEQRVGKPSARIYRENGEAYFRRFEREIIRELSGRHGLVIATGGGACLDPENCLRLALNGTFYWLQRPLASLSTYQRPIPQQRGVETLYRERAPIYSALAERTIAVRSVEETASIIIGETCRCPERDDG